VPQLETIYRICCSDLAIECFEKARRSRPLKPLQALKDFRIIYDASGGKASSSSTSDRGERSPPTRGVQGQDRAAKLQSRRAHSLSPVKDCSSSEATSAPTARGGAGKSATTTTTTTTSVPKSLSMYSSGKEKKSLQESGGSSAKTDSTAARQVALADTTSTARMRQGRRARDVGAGDAKDDTATYDTSKTLPVFAVSGTSQTDSTRGGKTSAKSAVGARGQSQSHGTSRELGQQQLPRRRVATTTVAAADCVDDNRALPSRGS